MSSRRGTTWINYRGIIDALVFISMLLCGLVVVNLINQYL